jgi:hypothetical protein
VQPLQLPPQVVCVLCRRTRHAGGEDGSGQCVWLCSMQEMVTSNRQRHWWWNPSTVEVQRYACRLLSAPAQLGLTWAQHCP